MIRIFKTILIVLSLTATWVVLVYHRAVFPKPEKSFTISEGASASWFPKEEYGIHQLVLQGSPYERGYLAGELTKDLLLRQELSLDDKLKSILPSEIVREIFRVLLMRWYWGAEKYFEDWMIEEMVGKIRSLPR